MSIIFENIDTKETVSINREKGGKFYQAKLSAIMNSSNMSPNSDRGQDFGWRLIPEQQAVIEQWESEPSMIDTVSTWAKVMVDDLTHAEFLSYMLYQQELGKSPEKMQGEGRRTAQQDYEARVAELKALAKPGPVAPFVAPKEVAMTETADVPTEKLEEVTVPTDDKKVVVQSTPAKEVTEGPSLAEDLKFDELKKIAASEGVSTEGMKSKAEVKDAILLARSTPSNTK